jgi:hypothetical protein
MDLSRGRRMKALVIVGFVSVTMLALGACSSAAATATAGLGAAATPTLEEQMDTPTMPTGTAPAPTPSARPAPGQTGNADVLHVKAERTGDRTWTFYVTVQHKDTGWEDYADGWDVLTPDGNVLKPDPDSPFTRELLHPHIEEQPVTRSQAGIVIPEGVTQVRVRAHDLVDGYGGREVVVDLTQDAGPDFEIERQAP